MGISSKKPAMSNTATGPVKNLHVDSGGQDAGHTESTNSLADVSPDKIKRRNMSPNVANRL